MGHFHFFTRFLILFPLLKGAFATTFTFINKCDYTVWPGILPGAGHPNLQTTGFVLPSGTSLSLPAPTGWSGRFWGRTGCNFDQSGHGSCATGDCGSAQVECNGAGAAPPATLAEFTLNGDSGQDFYDVSLVDGYNLPLIVEAVRGTGACETTGCAEDVNLRCPAELRAVDGVACRSACEAFGDPEYCCSGAYNSPALCKPTAYSQMFKSVCPTSYSYAYDDPTSTFTCSGADYAVTFCPLQPSQKSTMYAPPLSSGATASGSETSGSRSGSLFMDRRSKSWMASLATGDSPGRHHSLAVQFGFLIGISSVVLCLSRW